MPCRNWTLTRHSPCHRISMTGWLPPSPPTPAVSGPSRPCRCATRRFRRGELSRAGEEMGFVGTMIHGQTRGVFLDDPSADPVLATAERLGVPVYLHPAEPPPAVRAAYFSGLEPVVASTLATAGWGWHAECGLHVLRMVVGGVFQRFPGLQVIVGHMGENLPFSLARADEKLTPLATGLSATVADTALQHVHVTTCGYTTDPPLLCALMVFGADRMLFSVDYPFSDNSQAGAFLRDAPLSPAG